MGRLSWSVASPAPILHAERSRNRHREAHRRLQLQDNRLADLYGADARRLDHLPLLSVRRTTDYCLDRPHPSEHGVQRNGAEYALDLRCIPDRHRVSALATKGRAGAMASLEPRAKKRVVCRVPAMPYVVRQTTGKPIHLFSVLTDHEHPDQSTTACGPVRDHHRDGDRSHGMAIRTGITGRQTMETRLSVWLGRPIVLPVADNRAVDSRYDDRNPFFNQPGMQTFMPFVAMAGATGLGNYTPDYFGFRNHLGDKIYFSPHNRPLIVMTGNSELAGSRHPKDIASLLEDELRRRGMEFDVLNLAVNSYSLAGEIGAYVHFGDKTCPSLVIAHSGGIEYQYGMVAPAKFRWLGTCLSPAARGMGLSNVQPARLHRAICLATA